MPDPLDKPLITRRVEDCADAVLKAMAAIPGTLVVDLPPYTKDEVAEANAYLIRLGAIAPIRVKATKTDLRGGGVP